MNQVETAVWERSLSYRFLIVNRFICKWSDMSLSECRKPFPFVFHSIYSHSSLRGRGQLSESNRKACSPRSCRNMITLTSKAGRDGAAFIFLRCLYKRFPHSPLLHSTSVPWWQAHFKLRGASCLVIAHPCEELKASVWSHSIWKIMAISQQAHHYHTFVKREALEMQKDHKRRKKVSPGKSHD